MIFEVILNTLCLLLVVSLIIYLRWYISSNNVFKHKSDENFKILKTEYNTKVKKLRKTELERNDIKNQFTQLQKRMGESLQKLQKVRFVVVEKCKKNMSKASLKIKNDFKKSMLDILYKQLIDKITQNEKYQFYNKIDLNKLIQN